MLIQKPQTRYDIAIIGAGMVGASFALALCDRLGREVSILVVEATHTDPGQSGSPSFDDRSTALSFGSRQILDRMNIWEALQDSVTAIERIHVSDRGHFGSARLNSRTEGVAALGYVVENRRFGQVLNSALHESAEIELFAPARVESIEPIPSGMRLGLASEEQGISSVEASLVVLADGGR